MLYIYRKIFYEHAFYYNFTQIRASHRRKVLQDMWTCLGRNFVSEVISRDNVNTVYM